MTASAVAAALGHGNFKITARHYFRSASDDLVSSGNLDGKSDRNGLDTDLNGDHLSDLLIVLEGSNDVVVLLNRQLLAE